jgi:hypothetical protein
VGGGDDHQILSSWDGELVEKWRRYATCFTVEPDIAELLRQKYAK